MFTLNYFANDKILDCSKLKAFADSKVNVKQKVKFLLERVENIMGKVFSFRVIKSLDCVAKS